MDFERRLDRPRRHRLHHRGAREPAAVGARRAVRGVFWHDKSNGFVDNLHTDFTYTNGVTINNRRLGGRGLQRGGDDRRPRLLARRSQRVVAHRRVRNGRRRRTPSAPGTTTRRGAATSRWSVAARSTPTSTSRSWPSRSRARWTSATSSYATSYFERDDLAVNDLLGLRRVRLVRQLASSSTPARTTTGTASPAARIRASSSRARPTSAAGRTNCALRRRSDRRLNWIAGAYYEQGRYNGYLFLGDARHQLRPTARLGSTPTAQAWTPLPSRVVELPRLEGHQLLRRRLRRRVLGLHGPAHRGRRHARFPRRRRRQQ